MPDAGILKGKLVIITGPRGAGKTTLCGKLIDQAREAGWRVAGVLSLARVVDGEKTGIDVVDLASNERRELAVRSFTMPSEIRTTGYAFDSQAMAWANTVLAGSSDCDLLVVDELGPLELRRHQGWQAGLDVLDRGNYRVALAVIRPELLEDARLRWPGAEVIEISRVEDVSKLRLKSKRRGLFSENFTLLRDHWMV